MEQLRRFIPEHLRQQSSPVRIEPGIHPMRNAEYIELYRRMDGGDLSVHLWNTQVGQRMREYNSQVVTIDGLYSGAYVNVEKVLDVWAALPDRPSKLNDQASIYVVGGDPIWNGLASQGMVVPGSEEAERLEQACFEQDLTEQEKVIAAFGKKDSIAMGVSLLGIATGIYETYQGFRSGKADDKRRMFGPLLSLTSAGHYVTQGLLRNTPLQAVFAASDQQRERWQIISDLVNRKGHDTAWLMGRTAVMFDKHEEATRQLGLPEDTPGSVVMGAAHLLGAKRLQENRAYRDAAIVRYTKELMDTFSQIMQQTGRMTDEEARNCVFNYMQSGIVYKVTEPEGDHTDNIASTIFDCVNEKLRFSCPRLYHLLLPLNPLLYNQ